LIAAESGAGKTFVLDSVAAAVDAGVPWFGRRTIQGSTVHILFEADAVGPRLRALRDVQGYPLRHAHVILASESLSPCVSREGEEPSIGELVIAAHLREIQEAACAGQLPDVRLVSIDTVRASMTGSEDSSEHSSAYLRAVRRLTAVVPEAAFVLAHHAGWQDGQDARKRERGSSAWRGNVDATLYLEAGEYDCATGDAPLTLHTRKVRDGEKFRPLHLIRRRVELPGLIDRYGKPVTTCVIEADSRTREVREAEATRTADAAASDFDTRMLRLMADRPEAATSQDRLRVAMNVRKSLVGQSISRLVCQGWALPPSARGRAYTVTAQGQKVLAELSGSHQFPTVPGTVPSPKGGEPGTVPSLRGTVHGNCSREPFHR
jgi:hypothetical protein